MRFTFAILVMGESGRGAMLEALREGGFAIDEDATLRRGDDIVGVARLVSLDELQAMSDLPAVHDACDEGELPFAGRPAAAFVWSHAADEELAVSHLVPRLFRAARGTVVRLDDGRSRKPVALRNYSLDQLTRRHGFDDGEALLSRTDAEYQRVVLDTIGRRLAEANLDGAVGWFPTHHNPLGLSGELRRGGEVVADVESALQPLTVALWTFDWSILQERSFWID
jgi:hypothetical protein